MLSSTVFPSLDPRSFNASDARTSPRRLFAINVVLDKAQGCFLVNSSRLHLARLQKTAKRLGNKVFTLRFSLKPFHSGAGLNLELSQSLNVVAKIFHRQKGGGVSGKPALARFGGITKCAKDRKFKIV